MKFKVMFVSDGYPVEVERRQIRIHGLDWIRKEIGIGITYKRVKNLIPLLKRILVEATIEEEEVHESDGFFERDVVYIKVPNGFLNEFLNKYTYKTINIALDSERNIKSVNLNFEIDKVQIVNAWKNAGYPKE